MALTLRQCSRCSRLVDAMGFRSTDTTDNILYKIINDKDFKLDLEDFVLMCPVHTSAVENGTFYQFTEEERELLAEKPIGNIWITLE